MKSHRSHAAMASIVVLFSAFLAVCGKDSPTKPDPPFQPVASSVTITPGSAALDAVGGTIKLSSSVHDQNGNPIPGARVTWTSSNPAVAGVDAQGLVTAAGNGTVQITATSGNASASVPVSVMQASVRIVIEPKPATLRSIGESASLTAVVQDQNGNPIPGAGVVWTSSDPAVAGVDAQGLVTAAGNGTAQITATSGNASASVPVTVMQASDHIVIEPKSATLRSIGESVSFTASVQDMNGNPIPGAKVTWSSSNPAVASVDADGKVTAVAHGSIEITATSGDLATSVPVRVTIPSPDRDVLTALYNALDGPNWKSSTNWLSDTPLDAWHGVTLDGDRYVTSLNLGNNNLKGSIPAVLGRLSRLVGLALDSNDLTGEIPAELGQLTRLTHLYLFSNRLTGNIPPELGRLSNLIHLCLDRNQLTGNLPGELGRLGNLKWLHLFNNFSLTGMLPQSLTSLKLDDLLLDGTQLCTPSDASFRAWLDTISNRRPGNCDIRPDPAGIALAALYNATGGPNWKNNAGWLGGRPIDEWHGVSVDRGGRVVALHLDRNNLRGALPSQLGDLKDLTGLYLYSNRLTGGIPAEIGQLKKIDQLWMYDNQLTGSIPEELGQVSGLREVLLEGNQLTGKIPSELGNLARLRNLRLNHNQLTGQIPAELGQLSNLTLLWLQNNELTGPIPPELGRLADLEWLVLSYNRLTGAVPPELGSLTALRILHLRGNPGLTGPLPSELTNLNLDTMYLEGTQLCAPPDPEFQRWLDGIRRVRVATCPDSEQDVEQGSDRMVLSTLYHALGGLYWNNNENWLSDTPLADWHGVTATDDDRVTSLDLSFNNLSGSIPAELGNLSELAELNLHSNDLSGSIPPELGNLSKLRKLELPSTGISGEIPPELGRLTRLTLLALEHNNLSGSIPPELGNLNSLTGLWLSNNRLHGALPPELGGLANLESLLLYDNSDLTGALPREFVSLRRVFFLNLTGTGICVPSDTEFQTWLRRIQNTYGVTNCGQLDRDALQDLYAATDGPNWISNANWLSDRPLNEWYGVTTNASGRAEQLVLQDNNLVGEIPLTLRDLEDLKVLNLSGNASLSGRLPVAFTSLRLEVLQLNRTQICAPDNDDIHTWLAQIPERKLADCVPAIGGVAYLTQATQTLERPVPLIAGDPALLRVFLVTDAEVTHMPPLRARFYHGGVLVDSVGIAASGTKVPDQIFEGSLSITANAPVPGRVVAPGLEMVIDIDPENLFQTPPGIKVRIPESGRKPVDVRELPTFRLTLVPFLWQESPDYSVVTQTEGLTAGDDLFWPTRNLLPVGDMNIAVREPVFTSVDPSFSLADTENPESGIDELFREIGAIRTLDGSGGHYMGILRSDPDGGLVLGGLADQPGFLSISMLEGDVIAHELGHNLNLGHAPCGFIDFLDPEYPYEGGIIGSWGYDIRTGELVAPETPDLMSYCQPRWISDYNFIKALNYRVAEEDALLASAYAFPLTTLLLWGGVDSQGEPVLEPAFVGHSPPFLPEERGPYRLEGVDGSGNELFTLEFAMAEIADGPGGGAFAFALPVRPAWAKDLARVTLSGPEGQATLERTGRNTAAFLLDSASGHIRGILRNWLDPSQPSASVRRVLPEPGLEVVISRGIPDADLWRR